MADGALLAARRSILRLALGLSILAFVAVGSATTLAFLSPPDSSVRATLVVGTIVHQGAADQVLLVRQGDRWLGRVDDFPRDSVAHVRPWGSPGFFILRAADGTFRVLANRSPYRGNLIEWRDPLPRRGRDTSTPRAGFRDIVDGDRFLADGQQLSGPAPRPLDAVAVAVEGDRLVVAARPTCPPYLSPGPSTYRPFWCGVP